MTTEKQTPEQLAAECKVLASEALGSAERVGNPLASGLTIRQAADDRANLMVAIDRLAAIATAQQAEPVAWRCKDYAGSWFLFQDKENAETYQSVTGCLMQALYVKENS